MLDLNDIVFETDTQHTYVVSIVTEASTAQWTFSNFNVATKFARMLIQRAGADLESNYARLMQGFNANNPHFGNVDLDVYSIGLRARRIMAYRSFSYVETQGA